MKLSQPKNHHIETTLSSMDLALEFLRDNPTEKIATAARIYKVNANSLRSNRLRANHTKTTHGGHNKILSEAQIKAIYKYVEDSYHAGYGTSKQMVFMAICHLRAAEIPSKKGPSWRWFQTFMNTYPNLFRVVKTKAIARVRVTTHDISTVENWFTEYLAWCTQHNIQPQDVYNFDESGFRVGVAPGEEVVVPAYITEVHTSYYC
jgi:hypothetical protein